MQNVFFIWLRKLYGTVVNFSTLTEWLTYLIFESNVCSALLTHKPTIKSVLESVKFTQWCVRICNQSVKSVVCWTTGAWSITGVPGFAFSAFEYHNQP
jgi:hypothetical protein